MGDINKVLSDYKKFVSNIEKYSEAKVLKTVETISGNTNSQYSSDGVHENISLSGSATGFKTIKGSGKIDGIAYANETRSLIYLEFGTRENQNDKLTIRDNFKSGIDTIGISLPYKVMGNFQHDNPVVARYYFLNNIDKEGINFIETFGK